MTTASGSKPRSPRRTHVARIAPANEGLAAMLNELSALVKSQADEIAKLKTATPQFVKMALPDKPQARRYEPPEEFLKRKLKLRAGENGNARHGWWDDPKHLQSIPQEYWPTFHQGDEVRVNPDALVYGSDTMTWGSILVKAGSDGIGIVETIAYIDRVRWEPKYIVVVPGLTDRNGAGFRESELTFVA